MSRGALLRVSGLHKSYAVGSQKRRILDGVELQIEAGEIVALVGSSGSGKSTLLNIIAGLVRPDTGSVELQGKTLTGQEDSALSALRNQHIGFVFQAFHLLNHLSAIENVCLPAYFSPTAPSSSKRRERGLEVLEQVGLAGLCDASPTTLSGGQRQRIAIARALYNRPSLLLADEPTGNLDQETGSTILDLFDSLSSESSCGVLIVTHEAESCARAKRTLRLEGGKICP